MQSQVASELKLLDATLLEVSDERECRASCGVGNFSRRCVRWRCTWGMVLRRVSEMHDLARNGSFAASWQLDDDDDVFGNACLGRAAA